MAEKLVVISDMWGAKKGAWATAYLVYLQQYFNLTYYDCQQLANIDAGIYCSDKDLKDAFVNGGIQTAIDQLMQKEKEPCHYLAFGLGGDVVWKASLQGLPMKSLYAVSTYGLYYGSQGTDIPITLVYGSLDANLPSKGKMGQLQMDIETILDFGHDLYAKDEIIKKIAKDLLSLVTHKMVSETKVVQFKKPLLVS
ncbi:MAG: hypothetical protein CR994_03905 [Maribacter sp.]|nr:MAG: hypothetical protein CR994_03905 [Maribacter sp.]